MSRSPSTSLEGGKGTLTVNGKLIGTDWDLKFKVFGDQSKTYLMGSTDVNLVFDEPELRTEVQFDHREAERQYADDPVALAIIDRLARMEHETASLRGERDQARRDLETSRRMNADLQRKVLEQTLCSQRWRGDDPEKARKKPGQRR